MKADYNNTKFFVFGYFGWCNVGDDAIGLALLNELKKKYPNSKLKATVKDPYFLSKNDLEFVEIVNFSIISLMKNIKKADEFLIAGGTHFQDEDQFLFRRFKIHLFFLLMTFYARIIGKTPILIGHGIGPISRISTQIMVKIILMNSKSVIVRDHESLMAVEELGYLNKCHETFDLAILLQDVSLRQHNEELRIIGISLLPVFEIYYGDTERDILLVLEISKAIKELLKNNKNIQFKLFAFRSGSKHSDEDLLNRLSIHLDNYSNRITIVKYEGDVNQFLLEIDQCDGFIGMRYHSLIFSYITQKPFIAINYMEKCEYLTEKILLPKKACLELDDLDYSLIKNKINSMIMNPNRYKAEYNVKKAFELGKKNFDILRKIISK